MWLILQIRCLCAAISAYPTAKISKKPYDTSSIHDYVYTSVGCHYEYVVY